MGSNPLPCVAFNPTTPADDRVELGGPESDIIDLPDFISTFWFDILFSLFDFDVEVEVELEVEVEVRSISTLLVDDAVLVVAELWRDTVFVFVCVDCLAEDELLPTKIKKNVQKRWKETETKIK